MIGQIGCLVQASSRTGTLSALLYTLGVTLGAALVGLFLGTLGGAARWVLGSPGGAGQPTVLLPVALLALVGGLRDLGHLRVRLPEPRRQVPRGWLEVHGPCRAGFQWGLAVGLAYTTRVQYSLYYVLALWVLLVGSPLLGAEVLAVYGLAHGGLLTLEVLAMARRPGLTGGLLGMKRTEPLRRAGGAVLLACSTALLAAAAQPHLPAAARGANPDRPAAPRAGAGAARPPGPHAPRLVSTHGKAVAAPP